VTERTGEIRTAARHDLGQILKVDHLAAAGDPDRAALLRRFVDSGECLTFVRDGYVRGFAVVRPGHFFGRDFIDLLVVDTRHRRAGIGRALLRAAVGSAGTRQVFTSTNVSNRAMRALLEDEGWSFSGELAGLDQGDPELVFFKS
jgi:ribosomal protein S18 acetylase RimI-like enzyme